MIINKKFYDFASSEISVILPDAPAIIVAEMNSIDYGDGIDSETVYGVGKYPLGETEGFYITDDTNLTLLKKFGNSFVRQLDAAAKKLSPRAGAGDVDLLIRLKYRSRVSAGLTVDEIKLSRIKGVKDSASQGASAVATNYTGKTLGVTREGIML